MSAMDSLKTLSIGLSDIWLTSRTEMTEMNGKIKRLGDCLLTSDVIISHLTETNETLVEIIEKCQVINSPEVIKLINVIRDLEECIEREKDNLVTLKMGLKTNNGHKVVDLIHKWDKCVKMRDKCIQTTEDLFNINIKSNEDFKPKIEKIFKSDIDMKTNIVFNEDIKPKIETNIKPKIETNINTTGDDMKNSLSIDINCKSDRHLILQDMTADDCNDNEFILNNEGNGEDINESIDCHFNTFNQITGHINDTIDSIDADNSDANSCVSFMAQEVTADDSNDSDFEVIEIKSGKQVTNQMVDTVVDISVSNGSQDKHIGQHIPNHRLPTESQLIFKPKHKSDHKYDNRMKYKVDVQYVCGEVGCDYTSKSKQLFYGHYRRHSKAKSKYDLSLDRPYVCNWPECGQAFKSKTYFCNHVHVVHQNIKKFVCNWPQCDYKTASSHALKVHRQRHLNTKTRSCTWPECEYRCIDQWSLTAHTRKHTGEKPYSCPYPECGFRCSQPSALTAHQRKHSREKPYICQQNDCDKRFGTLSGLHMHRKSHHK